MTKYSNDQLLTLAKELITIESTAENLKGLHEAYAVIVRMLTESGKKITIEHFESNGKPSLLAYAGPRRPDNFRIILNAHLDVVPGKPGQYKPIVKDGRLYGRGVYDMKAAAVVIVDTFCEYVDKVPYSLGLQIVTDEESAGKDGAAYQVQQGVRGDFVICGECGRLPTKYEIANECKGFVVAEIGFSGSSSHGAYLWRGQNALLRATGFANGLLERYPIPTEETFSTTVNISSISTPNLAHTKVPDYATVRLDIRFTNDDPNFRSKQHFAALVEEIDANAEIVSITEFCTPVYSSPKNPLLQSLKTSAEKVEGHKFKFVMRHGTFDGRFFAEKGDQACEFGIAGEHQHGDDENIPLKAFDNYRATLHDFLAKTVDSEKENTNTKAFNP